MIKERDPNVRVVLISRYPFSRDRVETFEGIDASISKVELVRRLIPTLGEIMSDRELTSHR